MTSDSEFDFLLPAGQMKLTNIQKAQIKRERDKCMEELMSVLARVRLAVDEYNIAEEELRICESPDPEFEAEEKEKRKRERKIRREQRRALRKMLRQEGEDTTKQGAEIQKEDREGRESPESDEESSGSSAEEDEELNEADEKEAMGGQVKRQISQTMLIRVRWRISSMK